MERYYIKASWSDNDHGGVDLVTEIVAKPDEAIRAMAHILSQIMDKAVEADMSEDDVLIILATELADIRKHKDGSKESVTVDLSDWPIKQ